MVTKRRVPISRPPARRTRNIYLREWRKFMGTGILDLAEALDIERESYYRLERETYRISLGEIDILAGVLGVRPSQLWFMPPAPGATKKISLDDLLEDMPENVQQMAVNAVRGMIGK